MSITENHKLELLSKRYVTSVAAKGGYTISQDELDYGCDLHINEVRILRRTNGLRRLNSGRHIDVQIKATKQFKYDSIKKEFRIQLETKTYNDLVDRYKIRKQSINIPPFLCVIFLYKEFDMIFTQTKSSLSLSQAAYWFELKSVKRTKNKKKVTISVPENNLFTTTVIDNMIKTHFKKIP